MIYRLPFVFAIITTIGVGSAIAETSMPGPMLSQDEIDAMTMTPEEYEDQFLESLDDEDYEPADPNTCGLSSNTPEAREFMNRILGPWQMSHLAGYVNVGPMTLPYPASDEIDTITFKRVGTRLIGVHPEAPEPMEFRWPGEKNWRFMAHEDDVLFPAPGLSSEDLELVQDCKIAEMPRLIGRSTIHIEGAVMNFTYRLIVMEDYLIHGIMHVNGSFDGMPFFSARSVSLQR